jgi:hypothetical protein
LEAEAIERMSQDREPHIDLNASHNYAMLQETVDSINASPEPLYRLRISVLKDEEGTGDCPIRMFVSTYTLFVL